MNQLLPAVERWRRNSLAHWPVTDGPAPSSVQFAVDTLVARHAALRSRYGLDEQGDRVQWISPVAEVPVEFHDLGGRPDARAAGTEIAQQLCQQPFRLDEEFPVRVAAATDGTVVHWLFLVVHHIAVDALGMAVLRRELQSSLREAAVGQSPERAAAPDQPVDEVAYERTDRARRASEGSLKHWREIATSTPSTTLPVPPPDDRAPDSGEWSLASAQAAVAGQAVARRHGVYEPVVLLALFALALWGYTGSDRQVVEITASNRYAPGRMRVVTSVTQPLYVLFAELGPELRLSELLRRAREATMQVYRLGRYDEDAVAELLASQAFERGANLASVPVFNYVSAAIGASVDGGSVAGDLDQPELTWATATPGSLSPLALKARRDQATLHLSLRHRRSVVAATDAELLLRAMLRLLSAAGQDDDPAIGKLFEATGGPVAARGAGWYRCRGSWMSGAITAEILTGCPFVTAATVTDGGPPGVRAHVLATHRCVTTVELRSHLVGQLARFPAAGVPDAFVIHDGTGGDAPGPQWWLRADDIVEAGEGRDADAMLPDAIPGVRALRDAFARTHPGAVGDWRAAPYLPAGGRIAAIGPLLRELEQAGYRGLEYADLLSFRSLSGLASMLRRGGVA